MITNFQSKTIPKEKAPCKCLSMIMLDSVIKANKMYYIKTKKKYCTQTLLEECKYEQEKIKVKILIDDDLESLTDESDSEFDEDNDECNE